MDGWLFSSLGRFEDWKLVLMDGLIDGWIDGGYSSGRLNTVDEDCETRLSMGIFSTHVISGCVAR